MRSINATGDVLARSSTRFDVIMLLLVLLASLVAITRRNLLWPEMQKSLLSRASGQRYDHIVDHWIGFLDAVGLSLAILIVMWIAFRFVDNLSSSSMVVLVKKVLFSYAWYRLALAAAHHFFVAAAEAGPRTITDRTNQKIFRTVQVVGLTFLIIYLFLVISSQLLGRGYLYSLVVQFSWLVGIPVAYLLLRYWRDDIFEMYLMIFPKSPFSPPIRTLRTKFWSVVLLIPAFLHLSSRGVYVYLHEVALRFDRTRRVLAYIFRRQLERRVIARKKHSLPDESLLPIEVVRAFRANSTPRANLVDHFPKLDQALSFVEQWKKRDRGTTIALVGERGIGKTTWLEELAFSAEAESTSYTRLDDDIRDEKSLCLALSKALELGGKHQTVDDLVGELNSGPSRLLLLDHCQNMVLRSVGGLGGLEALGKLLDRTRGRHVWVCSFSRYIWEHVEFALRDKPLYRHVYILQGWSERNLDELIEKRMKRCNVEVSYESIFSAESNDTSDAIEVDRTRERFMRLLWDYTNGVPRVAMLYWLRSLNSTHEPKRLTVELFEAHPAEELEQLGEKARFVLLAVVSQENLTVEETSKVLRYPIDQCLSLLEGLRADGILKRYTDRYRVTVRWGPEVVRFLRRKHLLYS